MTKIILVFLFVFTFAVCAFPVLAQETAPNGMVSASVLNVRSGPGTSYTVLGTLRNGQVVAVSASNPARDWLFVCCLTSGSSGWVSGRYISQPFDPYTVPVISPLALPRGTQPQSLSPLSPSKVFLPQVGQ